MKMTNFIVIQDFMVKDLHLKGNYLLVYALIYGFSQDGKGIFNGSIPYIQDMTGISSHMTIYNILASLENKNLIIKLTHFNDRPNQYRANTKYNKKLLFKQALNMIKW